MRNQEIVAFQEELAHRMSRLHGGVEAKTEWATMRGELGMYSPCLDVAIGPFATAQLQHGGQYDEMLNRQQALVRRMYNLSNENLDRYGEGSKRFTFDEVTRSNWNARCYIAIEIENKVSRKHLMGGAINASALGRIGIAIGWTDEKVKAFVKLRSYLLYLAGVEKNTFNPINLLVLNRHQLAAALNAENE